MENQLIGITNGRNFRELGGYQTKDGLLVKHHKLLRGGHLGELVQTDLELLQAYNLTFDIDFRSKEEAKKEPDKLPVGAHYEFNPVFSEDLTNNSKGMEELIEDADDDPDIGEKSMLNAYTDIVTSESAQQAYQKFFDFLLLNDQDRHTLLFHCTAGKDRTGMGAVYLLSALGVDQATIRKDYLLTNITTASYVRRVIKELQDEHIPAGTIASIKALMTVEEKYLDRALTIIDHEYGGMQKYLQDELKLTNNDISTLKHIYLEQK